ncbi:MAG: ACT domain-containing protein, partial [Clostridium sp.]
MSTGRKVTFSMMVRHEKGLLSTILNEISKEGGNILTINQGIPINDVANLNITMDISSMEKNFKVFLNEINNIDGVDNVELIAIE